MSSTEQLIHEQTGDGGHSPAGDRQPLPRCLHCGASGYLRVCPNGRHACADLDACEARIAVQTAPPAGDRQPWQASAADFERVMRLLAELYGWGTVPGLSETQRRGLAVRCGVDADGMRAAIHDARAGRTLPTGATEAVEAADGAGGPPQEVCNLVVLGSERCVLGKGHAGSHRQADGREWPPPKVAAADGATGARCRYCGQDGALSTLLTDEDGTACVRSNACRERMLATQAAGRERAEKQARELRVALAAQIAVNAEERGCHAQAEEAYRVRLAEAERERDEARQELAGLDGREAERAEEWDRLTAERDDSVSRADYNAAEVRKLHAALQAQQPADSGEPCGECSRLRQVMARAVSARDRLAQRRAAFKKCQTLYQDAIDEDNGAQAAMAQSTEAA